MQTTKNVSVEQYKSPRTLDNALRVLPEVLQSECTVIDQMPPLARSDGSLLVELSSIKQHARSEALVLRTYKTRMDGDLSVSTKVGGRAGLFLENGTMCDMPLLGTLYKVGTS